MYEPPVLYYRNGRAKLTDNGKSWVKISGLQNRAVKVIVKQLSRRGIKNLPKNREVYKQKV
jgi:hypothetical protein